MNISVIIPTKDRPRDLETCIRHLQNQQEASSFEVIVVDCGRTNVDAAGFTGRSFPVRVLKSPCGLTLQRNLGMKAATGKYIAFLDDDCYVEPDYLKQIETAFTRLPDATGIHGIDLLTRRQNVFKRLFLRLFLLTEVFGGGELRSSGAPSYLDQEKCVKADKPIPTEVFRGCGVYSRSVIEDGFTFDEGLKGYCLGEDYEFSYRVSRYHRLYIVPRLRYSHAHSKVSRVDLETFYFQHRHNMRRFQKQFRAHTPVINSMAFFIYIVGLHIQALKDSIIYRNLSAFRGLWVPVEDPPGLPEGHPRGLRSRQ